MTQRGTVVVLSGPSGVGKDTIMSIITSKSSFMKFTTCTTRPPRPGEIDGVHYHFLDKESFKELWDRGDLLDKVEITNHFYGLSIQRLGKSLNDGDNIILHLATGSAFMLKKIIPDAITVFIMPLSNSEVRKRLVSRGMSEDQIQDRLRDDPSSLLAAKLYDFVVVNHNGEEHETAHRILKFIADNKNNASLFGLAKVLGIVEYNSCIQNF